MADATLAVTAGSGTLLHTNTRTISGTNHEEFVLPAEYSLPTYSVTTLPASVATTADHLLQIMAGSSLNVRIRRVVITQSVLVTAVAELTIICLRLTTAGSGGTAFTARPFDTADTAGATSQTLPSAKGTEGVELWRRRMILAQAWAATGAQSVAQIVWEQLPNEKPIIIPSGTSNGVAFKIATGRAGAQCDAMVEFVETSYL